MAQAKDIIWPGSSEPARLLKHPPRVHRFREFRRNTSKNGKGIHLQAKARIWRWLSYAPDSLDMGSW